MNYTAWGGYPNQFAGPHLSRTRNECAQELKLDLNDLSPASRGNITGCILEKFTEFDKALYASRQYILTLWPAFVGAIVALTPDPSSMIYDNVWWAILFGITFGGLPGLDHQGGPPHHVEATSEEEGRGLCEE